MRVLSEHVTESCVRAMHCEVSQSADAQDQEIQVEMRQQVQNLGVSSEVRVLVDVQKDACAGCVNDFCLRLGEQMRATP